MSSIPHTLTCFDEGLDATRVALLRMASATMQNVEFASGGLFDRNENLCNQAIDGDETVNQLEREVGQEGMEVLTRFTPLATDLRAVVGALKISTSLERISDLAGNIGRRSVKILGHPDTGMVPYLEPIFQAAQSLLADSMRAYSDGDIDLALSLHKRNRKLDKARKKVVKRLSSEMENNVENLKACLHLLFIAHCVERIGDLSVNIGEETVYIYRAADIRHVGPAVLDSAS